uniref:Uncharacterized protein n=1 Tax=Plectus sambesii TaxID=2011161 RepID=A0A914WMU8_9BILA
MVNAPVTGPVSFGDTLNNSQNTHNTITSHNDGLGMNLSGQITGNNHTFIQHYNAPSQASSTSSSFPSPSSTEDCQKKLET